MRRRVSQLTSVWLLGLILCLLFVAIPANAQNPVVLPPGQVNAPYSQPIPAAGGTGQLTWRVSAGRLPSGLSVSATDGGIEGTPTVATSQPATFDVTVSDSSTPPQTEVQHFSLVITVAPLHFIGIAAASAPAAPVTPIGADPVGPPNPPAVVPASESAAKPTAGPKAPAQPEPDPSTPLGNSTTTTPKPFCGSGSATKLPCGGQFLRTIVGFEQAGVSAAPSKQDFFFDLLYDRPLGYRYDPDLGPSFRSWGNLRISSVPQQINSGVAEFAASFAQQAGQVKVNQVAQSFEFLGGFQFRILATKITTNGGSSDKGFGGPENGLRHRISLNAIVAGGLVTPLTPQESVQVFDVPTNQPSFLTTYPQAAGVKYVAFSLEDRNRFFRQAYGGLRLMTHYLGDPTRQRAPETFDLTYGFNESVTGGAIHGGVLRMEGFVPIPYSSASWIYFFGTAIFKPGARSSITTPFLLDQAPSGTLPTDANAVVIPTPQTDRDYYRVGVGIDLVDMVKALAPKTPSTNKQPPPTNQ